jgi:hypothetical protein
MTAHAALERFRARDVTTPAPALDSFAALLYDALAPLAALDGQADWHLAHYCGALGVMFQPVADVARDTPDGPGWSAVLDLERCPDAWLPWLAQFVGVTIPGGSTPDAARAWIQSTDGFKRGTPAAMRGAVTRTLTGNHTVYFREREGGDPYLLEVVTLTKETPDPAATLAALIAAKPGGIVLQYRTITGWDYQQLTTAGPDPYSALAAVYPTYYDLREGPN